MTKGFTLIELLVVIAILAVLATAVVLVLNPAELLKQGRDSTRISDLAALNSALALYVADGNTTWTATTTCSYIASYGTPHTTDTATTTCSLISSTSVTSTGWVNVNFSSISSGSPLPRLPLDPNNGSTNCASTAANTSYCQYVFKASSTTGVYKLMANMESTKYTTSGGGDVESNTKDGGILSTWYEIGSNLSL
ncbi:MAG: hypothetical protein UY23_C0001G0009 [Candidatus Jorgensenbacteria bacterium GW2011_GWA1_48_11]|uniref:Uncharacterized protein n=1 Tax=Candidatus Jorgensenbacteria bacterium GW2011_GWA1_48_11 TaxID=1618660 RepID=A0A0G1UBA9_9BACT|nr:MAG: hypothetical protein UY23_C0001G0009 [Candidatus Jorgensenbacteria bacterium GW2011_GWA1_48_11]KKW11899.1 MAG: hypothetical protein UY51_C0005G0140 [Candidatus Jorgensenbacteria bacterium GW2011_GWB1_49_9]